VFIQIPDTDKPHAKPGNLCVWCAFGVRLVPVWSLFGPCLVPVWP